MVRKMKPLNFFRFQTLQHVSSKNGMVPDLRQLLKFFIIIQLQVKLDINIHVIRGTNSNRQTSFFAAHCVNVFVFVGGEEEGP